MRKSKQHKYQQRKQRQQKRQKQKQHMNFSGQHLLHNKGVIHKMIHTAQLPTGATVVDLGAGKGTIAMLTAEKAGYVIAVENDRAYAEFLRQKFAAVANIKVIERDIMQFQYPCQPFYVVANIPYSITTSILGQLLDQPMNSLQSAVLMVEKGAAKRFTQAVVDNPRVLQWRMWFVFSFIKTVTRENFSPPPRVDSAIIKITRKRQTNIEPKYHKQFFAFAKYGLRYPNMPVCDAFRDVFTAPQMKYIVRTMNIDRDLPVCRMREQDWEVLFQSMLDYVDSHRWPKVKR